MYKKLYLMIMFFIWASLSVIAEDVNETIVAKVGKENITLEMLENAYNKNISKNKAKLYELSNDSLYDFVDLYINYRLKVQDAKNKGLLESNSVLNDIETNRKILAESFFFEKNLTDKYVDEAIKRRENEVKVAIILKTFPQKNELLHNETKKAAQDLLKKVLNGGDFSKIAKESSDDKMTAPDGGVVPGYITSGKVQREIEEAVFNTPVGQIYPELIEAKYGFIILKVLGIEKRKLVYTSHILFSYGIGKDSSDVVKKADSVLALLNKGKDFAKLAKEVSDDNSTKNQGGSFGTPYSRSTGLEPSGKDFLPEFEKALFSLKDGEHSGKVFSDFGIHIIKRDSTVDFNREEELRELEATYKRIYYNIDKNELMDSLTEKYGINVNMDVLERVTAFLDTNYSKQGDFGKDVPVNFFNEKLYTFMGNDYSVKDYLDQMNSEKAVYGFGIDTTGLKKSIYVMNRDAVLDEATKNLENEYPDFKRLITEFKDGILLFKIEADEVWNKLKFDSVLARKYYDTLSSDILTEKEYNISEIFVKSEEDANSLYEKIKNGGDFAELAKETTMRQGYREKSGDWGTLTVGKDYLADYADKKKAKEGDVLEPFKYQSGWSIIKIDKIYPVRKKTFEEAISDIAPAVQDIQQKRLTKQWLEGIRKNTEVTVYKDKLNSAINKLRK